MTDADATTRFYEELWPHRAAVLRTAQFLAASDADADDLAQETLMKAFASISSFKRGSNAKAWLMTILRHAHVDRVRSRHSSDVSIDAMEIELPADEPEQQMGPWRDLASALEAFGDAEIIKALKALPPDICWTLLLVDVEGVDDQDAANVLGIPTGTVKSRLHRGRRMLRSALTLKTREQLVLRHERFFG